MLYLEHSVDSLARGGPWQLGTVLPGSCGWRALSEAETATYGGSTLRRLYGCAITMFRPDAHAHAPAGSSAGGDVRPRAESGIGEMFEQRLFTWSQVGASPSLSSTNSLQLDFTTRFLMSCARERTIRGSDRIRAPRMLPHPLTLPPPLIIVCSR